MKMNKKMLSAACIALVGVAALMPSDLTAVTPGGIPKKFIGLTFDVMHTSPSNVLANADKFAASVPFLDGVGLSIGGVPVVKENGAVWFQQCRSKILFQLSIGQKSRHVLIISVSGYGEHRWVVVMCSVQLRKIKE